ncbi:Sialic acid synthase, partial [Operophtera brumata]
MNITDPRYPPKIIVIGDFTSSGLYICIPENIKRSSTPEIRIYEVGPRDGLQNEANFVSPKWVKQMSDGVDVMKNMKRVPGVNYPMQCNVEEVAIFPAGSEGFSQKNLNCSVEEGLKRFKLVADQAVKDGLRVRGYVSCVITEQLLSMGCYEVSLGDTIGVGTAGSVRRLLKEVLSVATPDQLALHFHDTYGQGLSNLLAGLEVALHFHDTYGQGLSNLLAGLEVALHFHDTYGQGLSNLLAGLEFGIKTVDSSVSGLGGCPYARGASGNLATEDLVYLLYGLGVDTGIDLIKLTEAGRYISKFLTKPSESKVNRALGDRFKDSKDITEDIKIGGSNPCFIIAEVGQNHQGDIGIAKKLIKAAKDAGASCVKFQKTCLNEKFTKKYLERPYDNANSWGKTYGDHKRHLEFSESQYREIFKYANEIGILCTASAMDMVSFDFLLNNKAPFVKIGSGDSNNLLFLKYAASKKVPLIISTGMVDKTAVKTIYDIVSAQHKQFCLLHCVSAYPVPFEDCNLTVLQDYKNTFDIPVGYSGQEVGTAVLEKHITLDKDAKGTDHVCSLTPAEFQQLVRDVRVIEASLGTPIKKVVT